MSTSSSEDDLPVKKEEIKKEKRKSKKRASSSSEDESPVKKVETKKGKKRVAKEEDAEKPEKKKAKSQEVTGRPKDDSGNEMFEFGNMRFASVSSFKGKQYLNVREYYIDKNSGKMLPGKKGISLTKAQWENLKDLIPELDKKF